MTTYACSLTVEIQHKEPPPEETSFELTSQFLAAKRKWRDADPIERVFLFIRFELPFAPTEGMRLSGEIIPGAHRVAEDVTYNLDDNRFYMDTPKWFVWNEELYLKEIWRYEKCGWESFTIGESAQDGE